MKRVFKLLVLFRISKLSMVALFLYGWLEFVTGELGRAIQAGAGSPYQGITVQLQYIYTESRIVSLSNQVGRLNHGFDSKWYVSHGSRRVNEFTIHVITMTSAG